MEIKIRENNIIDYENDSIKTIKDNTKATFLETLNQLVAKSTSTKTSSEEIDNLQNDNTTTGIPRIDSLTQENKETVSKSIDSLNDIFHINILQNKDEFFNENSQIKISDILDNYGDNVKSSDLNELSITINTLMNKNMISNYDYFYALKWIAAKQEAFNVKRQVENTKNQMNDLTYKPKKSEHKINSLFA